MWTRITVSVNLRHLAYNHVHYCWMDPNTIRMVRPHALIPMSMRESNLHLQVNSNSLTSTDGFNFLWERWNIRVFQGADLVKISRTLIVLRIVSSKWNCRQFIKWIVKARCYWNESLNTYSRTSASQPIIDRWHSCSFQIYDCTHAAIISSIDETKMKTAMPTIDYRCNQKNSTLGYMHDVRNMCRNMSNEMQSAVSGFLPLTKIVLTQWCCTNSLETTERHRNPELIFEDDDQWYGSGGVRFGSLERKALIPSKTCS